MADNEIKTYYLYAYSEPNTDIVAKTKYHLLEQSRSVECDRIQLYLGFDPRTVFEALDLYDHVKLAQKPVDVAVSGYCTSRMLLVLQAAKERQATHNTWFSLAPFISTSVTNMRADEMQIASETIAQIEQTAREIVLERSGIKGLRDHTRLFSQTKLYSVPTAMQIGTNGLVDAIL